MQSDWVADANGADGVRNPIGRRTIYNEKRMHRQEHLFGASSFIMLHHIAVCTTTKMFYFSK